MKVLTSATINFGLTNSVGDYKEDAKYEKSRTKI